MILLLNNFWSLLQTFWTGSKCQTNVLKHLSRSENIDCTYLQMIPVYINIHHVVVIQDCLLHIDEAFLVPGIQFRSSTLHTVTRPMRLRAQREAAQSVTSTASSASGGPCLTGDPHWSASGVFLATLCVCVCSITCCTGKETVCFTSCIFLVISTKRKDSFWYKNLCCRKTQQQRSKGVNGSCWHTSSRCHKFANTRRDTPKGLEVTTEHSSWKEI